MTVFLDTSGLYAVLDRDDANHLQAKAAWAEWLHEGAGLVTNNYVLVETAALLQHRIGVAAVRALHEEIVPLLQVDWVTEEQHRAGMEAVLAAGRKKLSLVDCVSFQTMRGRGVRTTKTEALRKGQNVKAQRPRSRAALPHPREHQERSQER